MIQIAKTLSYITIFLLLIIISASNVANIRAGATTITNLTYYVNVTSTTISIPTSSYPVTAIGISSPIISSSINTTQLTPPSGAYSIGIQSLVSSSLLPNITQSIQATASKSSISFGIYGLIPFTVNYPITNTLYSILNNPPKPKAEVVEAAHSMGGSAHALLMYRIVVVLLLSVIAIWIARRYMH